MLHLITNLYDLSSNRTKIILVLYHLSNISHVWFGILRFLHHIAVPSPYRGSPAIKLTIGGGSPSITSIRVLN